jgi:hypothetical protein
MTLRATLRLIACTGAFASAIALLYARVARPWHLHWGATASECAGNMPLDERVADATVVSTRGITIDAPATQVWPWLVQMGDRPRAGYYSYAWIERMQGMRIENAKRILPEFQSLKVGDTLDRNGTIAVLHAEPGRSLVLGPPERVEGLRCTWAFELISTSERSCRLVTRVRAKLSYWQMLRGAPIYVWPFLLLLDPGVFVMERKMLREIKRLAEAMPASRGEAPSVGGGATSSEARAAR